MPALILASNSPRRRELLALSGLPFIILPVDIDESPLPNEKPDVCVRRLAETKALTAAHLAGKLGMPLNQLILASDTIVVYRNEILGKPRDAVDASRMLTLLRGQAHQVLTAISFSRVGSDELTTDLCSTDVPMRDYSDPEMMEYIQSGDPMDKAGAYAIQHAGFHPVESMRGCYASVMGLPLCHITRDLDRFGIKIVEDMPAVCQQYLGYVCPVYSTILGDYGSK